MDIAIIDSGVILEKLVTQAVIKEIKKFSIDISLNDVNISDSVYAVCDHGTNVINTIEKYRNNLKIQYYVMNIINDNGYGSSQSLLEALKYIYNIESIKVIVMSLTFTNDDHKNDILNICNDLIRLGKILIAADSNGSEVGMPAVFENVLGIGRGIFKKKNRYIYNKNSNIQIIGDITPEFIIDGNGRRKIFAGTSKAAAKITPTIINAIEKSGKIGISLEKYLLYNSASQDENILENINESFNYREDYFDTHEIIKMIDMINKFKENMGETSKLKYTRENIFYNELIEKKENIDLLLEFLCENFNNKDLFEDITFFNFKSLFDIMNYFKVGD